MKVKRKILIIIPSLSGGGAERVLINLFNLIDLNKYEIDLFIGVKGGVLEKKVPEKININYIFSNKLLEKICYRLYVNWNCTFLFNWFGKKINKNYDVGVCYLDSFYTEFLFHNKGKLNKKVVFIHSSYKSYKNKISDKNHRNFESIKNRYNRVDTIVSVAHEALEEFKSIFGEYKDMRVIYNAFNIEEIIKLGKENDGVNFDQNKINLIAVGSHFPVKGYDKLIKACKKLDNDNLKFQLTILGGGFLKKAHQELIKQLNLEDKICLKGFVSNPYKWISQADVYVMTSEAEGLPTGLCEAIILHKPVLVTDVPGCREIVNHGEYGLMVHNSSNGIFNGLKDLINSKDIREYYRIKSIERANYFDDNRVIKEYYNILDI